MISLVEEGLTRRYKKDVCLIERKAVKEVLTTLKKWI
jgi:hypothetical protein